ncbi:MAG: hypothetical protein AAB407_03125 [Patescibacteria group bacterium]
MQPSSMHLLRLKRGFKKRAMTYIVFCCLVLAGVAFIFFIRESGFFRVTDVTLREFSGNADIVMTNIRAQMVDDSFLNLVGPENMLFWKKGTISLPFFKEASITKNWIRRTVTINITEYSLFAVWCDESLKSCLWIDEGHGFAFEEALVPDGGLIPKILDKEDANLGLGRIILPSEEYVRLRDIVHGVGEMQIATTAFLVERSSYEVTATLPGGKSLLFSLRFDPQETLAAMEKVFNQTKANRIQYIDGRVEGKLYVKEL